MLRSVPLLYHHATVSLALLPDVLQLCFQDPTEPSSPGLRDNNERNNVGRRQAIWKVRRSGRCIAPAALLNMAKAADILGAPAEVSHDARATPRLPAFSRNPVKEKLCNLRSVAYNRVQEGQITA